MVGRNSRPGKPSLGVSTMFSSHRRAGTGIVFVETRDEAALLVALRRESNGRTLCVHYATDGPVLAVNAQGRIDARPLGADVKPGLGSALNWAPVRAGNRILVIFDLSGPINNPGIWRRLISALPVIRETGSTDNPLVICASPSWSFSADNPLRGLLPVLQQPIATRDEILAVLRNTAGAPKTDDYGPVLDALAGLTAASAEQVAAESIVANSCQWVPSHLRKAREAAQKDGGLEIRPAVSAMGGLESLKDFFAAEVIPWAHDKLLAVRRVMFGGVPGVGKSYAAAGLAGMIGCECVELSPSRCKGSLVGQSEANFRRALKTIDALAADAPLVCLIDEVDKLATSGLDGVASSGIFAELLGWLDNRDSLAITICTLNRVDKIDAALESRFPCRWVFDLPCARERIEIALIHAANLGA